MPDMMTIKEASEIWGIGERRITTLCKEGRIPGAIKNKCWFIPSDAEKPDDNRVRSGRYVKAARERNLPLPIGVSDYRSASSEYYYVDKTMMIKEFLDERAKVSLFTRPRRFGKTLNMDMFKTYFEICEEDTSVYFRDRKIWSCGQKYRDYQGKYPVIFITFKDVKNSTWADSLQNIASVLSCEYLRHEELENSTKLNSVEKEYYRKIAAGKADEVEMAQSLLMLSGMLDKQHGIAPVIIIDEYDTPIQQGYTAGFYDQAVLFMRNFFSGGLKDNPHLSFGLMTGILRVAKESIFSGLNNLIINSVMDRKYSEYFGFTAEEIKEMAGYYHAEKKFREICEWYDGYRFGETEIFNPWSVSYYFSNHCEPGAYWLATGSNDLIGELLQTADDSIAESLQALLQGETVLTGVDPNVIYPQIRENPSEIFSILLVAGYLKSVKTEVPFYGEYLCELAIPNHEIAYVYRKEILERMTEMIPRGTANDIQVALYKGDAGELKRKMENLLMQSVSFYDTAKESFYHGLVLGLCAIMDRSYEIMSNKEAGEGRFDLCLKPRVKNMPGILIELKASADANGLKQLAGNALEQIREKNYEADLHYAGVDHILRYGVAFSGKHVEIAAG